MANERKFYCLCEHNCKFETMTKEQILAAITQAVEAGAIGDVDKGFVSRVVEQNKQGTLYFWVGTQAEYNALETIASDCHYFITDDSTKADIYATIAQFADYLKAVEEKTNAFGAVLFEDTNGVAAKDLQTGGGEIEFDAGNYNTFAVTIKFFDEAFSMYGCADVEATIVCTRTKATYTGDDLGWYEGDTEDFIEGGLMRGHKQNAFVSIDYGKKVVTVASYYNDSLSTPTISRGVVTKIVGLM